MKNVFRVQRCFATALLVLLLLTVASQIASAAGAAKPPATKAPASQSALTSLLIVAQDTVVSDPNFNGSIVVVMNNAGPAPVGVIINRPMPLTVARFFPKLKQLARLQDRIYFGGPVEFGTVWYLFRAKTAPAPATAIRVCDGVYVSSDDQLLLKLLARSNPMQGLRIFLGHAGWAPGQLQMEIQGGAWSPRRADADSIFNPRSTVPWPSAPGPKSGT